MRHGFLTVIAAAWFATAAQAVPDERLPAGTYQGSYVCPQGETAVTLTVSERSGGRQAAEFAFGGNDGVPSGAYVVSVRIAREGEIVLTPQRWIVKPDGYEMVGARLRPDGEQFAGTITNAACRGITLRRSGAAEVR